MLRRDYILRMIQQFVEAIAKIGSLKAARHWDETSRILQQQFLELVGLEGKAVCRLSENELLALLMKSEPVFVVRDKTLMIIALLKEEGDLAAAKGNTAESREFYLKGLHLLIHVAGGEAFEMPEFVPTIDLLVNCLQNEPLPGPTLLLLMQHYERTGQLAKAEDALFELLESDNSNMDLVNFGITFYERLQRRSDRELQDGNLPRAEVDASLRALSDRKGLASR